MLNTKCKGVHIKLISLKVRLRRGMHYANFDDIFSEDLNSTDAQYFIENAASNMMSCKRGHTYPTAPSHKLNWDETNPKS